jgi:NAD(P)-dependent dehydrogenase (short-subunit alcohol dehydrogenase family)
MTHPLFDITGRTALVTGSSRGIGRALAEGLARAGAEVIVNARNADALAVAVDEIKQTDDRRCWSAGIGTEDLPDQYFDVAIEASGAPAAIDPRWPQCVAGESWCSSGCSRPDLVQQNYRCW